jgi:uncharacterized protein (TIGR04255 family)
MGRKYKNASLVEAVCESRLSQDTNWDLTVPGRFYERVKDTVPYREQRVVPEFDLSQGPQVLQQTIRASERVLMISEDRKTVIQLGPRVLAINVLQPYPSWPDFKARIEKAWNHLRELVQPRGLERIGLRYINRVDFGVPDVRLEDYFDLYPFVGSRLPQRLASFVVMTEFAYHDNRDRLRAQLMPGVAGQGKPSIYLDLDYFTIGPGKVEVPDVLTWVQEAHLRVEEVFEGCITDRLRAMFEEVS